MQFVAHGAGAAGLPPPPQVIEGSDQLASSLCSWWDSLKAGSNAAV